MAANFQSSTRCRVKMSKSIEWSACIRLTNHLLRKIDDLTVVFAVVNLLLSADWRTRRKRSKRESRQGQAGQLINRSRRIADGAYPWVKEEQERCVKMGIVLFLFRHRVLCWLNYYLI